MFTVQGCMKKDGMTTCIFTQKMLREEALLRGQTRSMGNFSIPHAPAHWSDMHLTFFFWKILNTSRINAKWRRSFFLKKTTQFTFIRELIQLKKKIHPPKFPSKSTFPPKFFPQSHQIWWEKYCGGKIYLEGNFGGKLIQQNIYNMYHLINIYK